MVDRSMILRVEGEVETPSCGVVRAETPPSSTLSTDSAEPSAHST